MDQVKDNLFLKTKLKKIKKPKFFYLYLEPTSTYSFFHESEFGVGYTRASSLIEREDGRGKFID